MIPTIMMCAQFATATVRDMQAEDDDVDHIISEIFPLHTTTDDDGNHIFLGIAVLPNDRTQIPEESSGRIRDTKLCDSK